MVASLFALVMAGASTSSGQARPQRSGQAQREVDRLVLRLDERLDLRLRRVRVRPVAVVLHSALPNSARSPARTQPADR